MVGSVEIVSFGIILARQSINLFDNWFYPKANAALPDFVLSAANKRSQRAVGKAHAFSFMHNPLAYWT